MFGRFPVVQYKQRERQWTEPASGSDVISVIFISKKTLLTW